MRENPRWVTQVREAYVLRRDNVAMRPPRTYVEQTRLIERNVTITRNITVDRSSDDGDAAQPVGGRPDRGEEFEDGASE